MQAARGTPLSSPGDTPATPRRRGRLLALLGCVAILAYACDRVSKTWAANNLDPYHPRPLVGSLLQLQLVQNPGAAFSLATSQTWVLSVIAAVVILVIIYSARNLGSRLWAVALGLLLGGATGNLTDRLIRPPGFGRGHVIDFLVLPHWPIFNIADSCIVTAAVLIGIAAVGGYSLTDGRAARGPGRNGASPGGRNAAATGADDPQQDPQGLGPTGSAAQDTDGGTDPEPTKRSGERPTRA